MERNKSEPIPNVADRMGRFIGQLRVHEGITLNQLAHGLCTLSYLNKIENGEREVGKQLTDAFFQRLGKPVEMFERILDWDEFQQWSKRQKIIAHLYRGEVALARSGAAEYRNSASGVLDQQFIQIVELNCYALSGIDSAELLPMVCETLKLTQPTFETDSLETLLLSQNEGCLLFAYLRLREKLEGYQSVEGDYKKLLHYLRQERYDSREQLYLFPYVACKVIENDYHEKQFFSALSLCDETLELLTKEKRLFAYDQLLAWKQKLFDAMGNTDRTPERLLEQLQAIQAQIPARKVLLVPCAERGHVYCLNQVIRDRRRLFGISQERLSADICGYRSLSRIETQGGNLHRKNRKLLLQRVNMSGERYDYEVISERYDDYLLRSDLDRALKASKINLAEKFFCELSQRIPNIPVNRQYIMATDIIMRAYLPESDPRRLSQETEKKKLEELLQLTLPLDLQQIEMWPVSILTINELLNLMAYALCFKRQKEYEKSLAILSYIIHCLENTGADVSYYEDLYTRVGANIASVLDDQGLHQKSVPLLAQCMNLSMENQNSNRLAKYLYGIACGIEAQLPEHTVLTQGQMKKEILSILKQAYAAAVIAGDFGGQQFIQNYCLRIHGIELKI